eukprot:CAMPEP_0184315522 /NCGR_PEP_ID=MMETSP1049-20130417/83020_1 /TAXON_ID=77928 /ORGANISM="Proteomonas sulcata, Strain CCMP704" /LENGTH=61 /DNA_ID=CAMNT_0026634043 /DNA_START=214 /DNA_END=399 /DNA_ORIENTATION=-
MNARGQGAKGSRALTPSMEAPLGGHLAHPGVEGLLAIVDVGTHGGDWHPAIFPSAMRVHAF